MEKIDSVNKKKNTCLVLRSKNKSGKLAIIKILGRIDEMVTRIKS